MSEKPYDEQIAPMRLEVAKLCERHGLPMLATVWYDGDDSGTTMACPTPNAAFTLASAAHQCHGNLDRMCFALARQVPEQCDGSIVLRMLRRGEAR